MSRAVAITCAITGSGATVGKHPSIPVTPRQIADSALGAARAGAAIVHIHVRDPVSGKPSGELALYREVVDRIRDKDTDLIINLTTGYGGRLLLDDCRPPAIAANSVFMSAEDRVAHICELKPEICSLDMGSFNFGASLFVNLPSHLERMARLIRGAGVCPELEVFDTGHVRLARHFLDTGILGEPAVFQLCLGVQWAMPATLDAMKFMRGMLPREAIWSAFGISAAQFLTVAIAIELGGNVRVGLEDNLYLDKGVFAPDNAALVRRAVEIVEAHGHTPATPTQARRLLGLDPIRTA